jgi:hypothetical protein
VQQMMVGYSLFSSSAAWPFGKTKRIGKEASESEYAGVNDFRYFSHVSLMVSLLSSVSEPRFAHKFFFLAHTSHGEGKCMK